MKNLRNLRGFTLAEVMIVLTVIGVLTAILLPVARQSMPDENLMKFKKAHNTLGTVIRELVTSDKYYLDGDLGVKPNSDLIDGTHNGDNEYFCETMVDILNIKEKYCKVDTVAGVDGHLDIEYGESGGYDNKKIADNECKKRKNRTNKIVLSDGVELYIANPDRVFGQSVYDFQNTLSSQLSSDYFDGTESYYLDDEYIYSCAEENPTGNCNEDKKNTRLFNLLDSGFKRIYVVLCIDIDGTPSSATFNDCVNECPFGYGIRADGKILTGKRADEWLERDVNEE